jgi:acyl-CoA reductase-like NAD-dependent aldehyde dehydrogenase
MCRYCEKNFPQWLTSKKVNYVRPGFLRKQNYLLRQSLGTVGVITPTNFPFSLAMMSIVYILLAGNTVLLKPSEKSSIVAHIIEELLREAKLLPEKVNLLLGGSEIGELLVKHQNIKKVFFFGRKIIGKEILKKCTENYKTCVLELGGGSTALIEKSANIELAASGIAWSGFYSNGQSCVGTDRVFVEKEILKEFLNILKKKVQENQKESQNQDEKVGVFDYSEITRLKAIIGEAKNEGCEVICGGNSIQGINDQYSLEYTILQAPTLEINLLKEEIYGPIIVIFPLSDIQIAIQLINQFYPSLGVSIWMNNQKKAISIARNVLAGMIWINDTSFGLPNLPWLGRGETGWGQIFSEYSLHEVLYNKWISYHPSMFAQKRIWWNPYTPTKRKLSRFIANKLYRI